MIPVPGGRPFLMVVNISRTRPVKAALRLQDRKAAQGRVYWFALDPEFEVFEYRAEHTVPRESALDEPLAWTFPPASVSAVELQLRPV